MECAHYATVMELLWYPCKFFHSVTAACCGSIFYFLKTNKHLYIPKICSLETMVVDIGPPADWVKINVQRTVRFSFSTGMIRFLMWCVIFSPWGLTSNVKWFVQKDCYEVYALVPGLLREEVNPNIVISPYFCWSHVYQLGKLYPITVGYKNVWILRLSASERSP